MSNKIIAEFFFRPNGRRELSQLYVQEPGSKSWSGYDVDFSKAYGYVFHNSSDGCGPVPVSGPYWTNAGTGAVIPQPSRLCDKRTRKLNGTHRLSRIPIEFRTHQYWQDRKPTDLLDWLEQNAIESDVVWCSTCNDCFPTDNMCEHCFWCEKIGWYSTPSEPCSCVGNHEDEE